LQPKICDEPQVNVMNDNKMVEKLQAGTNEEGVNVFVQVNSLVFVVTIITGLTGFENLSGL
jgi:hypothetical protein